jgi:hypothetical protein
VGERYSANAVMPSPHPFLWHYLWVAPHILLIVLAVLTWRRKICKLSPAFFAYLVFEAIQGLTLYVMDRLPSVSDNAYWRADIVSLFIEALVKLAVIWELYSHLVRPRPSVVRLGTRLIVCAGTVLAALAAVAAEYAPIANYAIVSHAQILEEAIYIIESGLLLFTFLFAAYQHLTWDRRDFGIALGLGISACVGLGVIAIYANRIFFAGRYLLDFLNAGTYHLCVLIWFYYLLSPESRSPASVKSHLSPHPKMMSQIRQLFGGCGQHG